MSMAAAETIAPNPRTSDPERTRRPWSRRYSIRWTPMASWPHRALRRRGRSARQLHQPPERAGTEIFRFPPVMSRRHIEKAGYLKSFPNLLGCVCALHGGVSDIQAAVSRFENGGNGQARWRLPNSVSLPPSCYPVYPLAAERATVPAEAGVSMSPAIVSGASPRAISIGCNPSACANMSASARPIRSAKFRERWARRGIEMAAELKLACKIDQANDRSSGGRPVDGRQPRSNR